MTESTSTRTRSRAAVKAMASHRLARPVSTSERVADALRDEISDGVLPPGVQLVEESLAEALGVSRNTVRESFALLAGEGIVDRIPSRGVFVAILGVDDVHDLYRARMMVEGSAMRWGNPADAAVLGEMHRCLSRGRECRDAGDWDGVARANHSFHRAVASLTGSDRTTRWFAGTASNGDADYETAAQLTAAARRDPRLVGVATFVTNVQDDCFSPTARPDVDAVAASATEVIELWR